MNGKRKRTNQPKMVSSSRLTCLKRYDGVIAMVENITKSEQARQKLEAMFTNTQVMNKILNESWLHGRYQNGEINTSLPYIAVNEPEFFAQGESAELIIGEIWWIWRNGDKSCEQAFNEWVNLNL